MKHKKTQLYLYRTPRNTVMSPLRSIIKHTYVSMKNQRTHLYLYGTLENALVSLWNTREHPCVSPSLSLSVSPLPLL